MRHVFAIAALLLASVAHGQVSSIDHGYYASLQPAAVTFNWSPAAPHHEAVVQVQAGNQGGSGVYVEVDGVYMVLTCAHVIGTMDGQGRIVSVYQQATATFRDGTKRTAQPRNDKFGNDIAGLLIEKHPTVQPIRLAAKLPARPRVEMLGYAGREGKLRHWWGDIERGSSVGSNWYTAGVGSGDSGGPVLNEQHELVGLLAHGDTSTRDDTDGWATYHRAGGPAWTPLRNFAIRLRAFANPSGNNPPLNERPQRSPFCPNCPDSYSPPSGGGGGLYPPDQPYEQPEPQPTPAEPRGCQCPDYSGRLAGIESRLDGLESRKDEIKDWLEANRESLRGPQGPPGKDGIDGSSPSTSNDITHAVLVVDRSATYWPRLSVALERARQRFNGIRIAPPPEFATQLPALVFYENGKPVLVRKGERDVTHTLTAIERGDLSFLQES